MDTLSDDVLIHIFAQGTAKEIVHGGYYNFILFYISRCGEEFQVIGII